MSDALDIDDKRPELTPSDRRLTIAAAATPIAWLLQLGLAHSLARWMCLAGTRWPVHALTAITVATALIAGLYCWRRRSGEELPERERGGDHGGAEPWSPTARLSRRALAWSGFVLAAFFALLAFVTELPGFVLEPCAP